MSRFHFFTLHSSCSSLHAVLFMILFLALISCKNEGYETGDGEYSKYRVDFVEAFTDQRGLITIVETDDGRKLQLDTEYGSTAKLTPDSVYRALLSYDLEDDNSTMAKVRGLSSVPTPHIIHPSDTLGNDPIDILAIWQSKSRRYLNFTISFKTGQVNGEDALHYMSFSKDSVRGKVTHLTLHHQQNGAPLHYTSKNYISLRVSEIKTDSVAIHTNSYENQNFVRYMPVAHGSGR